MNIFKLILKFKKNKYFYYKRFIKKTKNIIFKYNIIIII